MNLFPSQDTIQPAVFGPVRRKPDIATRIAAEEIRLLIDLGASSRYTMAIGILVVGAIFSGTAPLWSTGVVLAIQILAQLYFDRVRKQSIADPDFISHAMHWARRYTVGTCISGLTWGVGTIVWVPGSDFAHHIFYVLVLAAVSMSSAVMRANYLPAALSYIVVAVTPMIVLATIDFSPLNLGIITLGILFLVSTVGATRRINRAYRDAIRLRFENADLIERMARAHAATEQKRADAEDAERIAKAANRTKGEFLDILGREVSAPLDTLASMARELNSEPLSEAQHRLTNAMTSSSETLRRLFDEMVDFSQMEAQTLELKRQRFDPVELVKGIIRDMRPLATQRHLSLELDIVPGPIQSIIADPDRLRQVLVNLISNSIKFTESGGVILRLQAVSLPDQVQALRLSVIDTGIGLTSDARLRLFEGFAQGRGKGASDAGPHGMGLGLAISDRLVRLMGGQIEVDSAAGQGSTFWFLLPLEMPQAGEVALSRADRDRPSATAPDTQRAGRAIDHDYLYEMERALGPDKATDRIIDALTQIFALHAGLEAASGDNDDARVRETAGKLRKVADEIGLLVVADTARSLEKAGVEVQQDGLVDLQRHILEALNQLARAYPNLSMDEPKG